MALQIFPEKYPGSLDSGWRMAPRLGLDEHVPSQQQRLERSSVAIEVVNGISRGTLPS